MVRTASGLRIASGFAALGLALAGLMPVSNYDTFGHLAAGRQIAQLGVVPRLDTFSFFRDTPQPWTNYEWLSDLVFWGAYAAGGFDALLALKLVALALAAALLVRLAWQSSGDASASACAALLVAAIPAIRFRLSERPHVLGILLASIYLLGLSRVASASADRRPRLRAWGWVAGLAGAHLIWVNLHGSNLLGLAMTAIALALSIRAPAAARRLAVLLALQLLASCVSPYGPAILIDSVRHVLDPQFRALVLEWAPWDERCPLWWLLAPVVQTVLLAAVAVPLIRRGRRGAALLAVALLLAVMAFRSIRFMAEFMILSAPVVAIGLASLPRVRALPWKPATAAVFAAASTFAVLGSAFLVHPTRPGHGLSTTLVPAVSAEVLAAEAPGARILASVEDSWFLMFALPRARFLVDGRVPFYGAAHVRRIAEALGDPALLRRLIDEFGVDAVVVRHVDASHQAFLNTMRELPGWRLVLVEDRYATYLRELPERRGLLARRALTALEPSYEPGFVLGEAADTVAVRRELGLIPRRPNTTAYRAWVQGLLALRPLAVAGGRGGLRPAATAAERHALAAARRDLDLAGRRLPDVPTIAVHQAMAAVAACDLEAAGAILDRVESSDGGFRETLLVRQEIALRQGRVDEVRDFVERARRLAGAGVDPWVEALATELGRPRPCNP
jgi:hypothetical protein